MIRGDGHPRSESRQIRVATLNSPESYIYLRIAMCKDSKEEAKRLAAEIFGRTMSASNAVYIFRWMGQLGLPHAKNQAAWEHERTAQEFATEDKYAPVFIGGRQDFIELGFFDKFAKALTERSVATFESALDAASLIFAHSVLDGAAIDWCRVCALAEPEDLMRYVEQRTVPLFEVKKASFLELRDTAIRKYLDTLERESVIKKLDIPFSLCPPAPEFQPILNYRYDRGRVVALDNLRHDYVHRRAALGVRLPQGGDDLLFLMNTTNFLLPVVCLRYGIRIDPNHAIAAM